MKTIPVFTLRDLLLFKLSKWVVTYMLLSVHALAQPPELTPADIKALQHTVIPLRNADTGSLDQDLEFLDEFVAGAKVVALGEPTHGAREAFLFKYRIIRYLVEEHGFNTIAMEANLPEARSVDSYINAGSGDGRSALGKLFGIWNTHEVLDLIEWLRRHNETSIQPVRFHGIDT